MTIKTLEQQWFPRQGRFVNSQGDSLSISEAWFEQRNNMELKEACRHVLNKFTAAQIKTDNATIEAIRLEMKEYKRELDKSKGN